jgi:hypothetical protein
LLKVKNQIEVQKEVIHEEATEVKEVEEAIEWKEMRAEAVAINSVAMSPPYACLST